MINSTDQQKYFAAEHDSFGRPGGVLFELATDRTLAISPVHQHSSELEFGKLLIEDAFAKTEPITC